MSTLKICGWCGEEIRPREEASLGAPFHRECAVRSVVGSIAHQEHKCACYGFPEPAEPGATQRERARLAFEHWRSAQRNGAKN